MTRKSQLCKELKDRYQFRSDGLIVLPPHSAREIVVEGQKLHHCVGGYARSMAEKRTVILFTRQEAKRNKPFFTVEVQGDKIYQVRGSNNRTPVPEVSAFLDKCQPEKQLTLLPLPLGRRLARWLSVLYG